MIDSTGNRSCTIQLRNGDFCDQPSHPDAPFPICAHHARQAYEFGTNLIGAAYKPNGYPKLRVAEYALSGPRHRLDLSQKRALQEAVDPAVYFIALDGLIKIGASRSVRERIRSYPPSAELLHIHRTPKPFELEAELHRRFVHLRAAGREWFKADQEILDCILELLATA